MSRLGNLALKAVLLLSLSSQAIGIEKRGKMKSISAKDIKMIRHQATGRMDADMTLDIETLTISGVINKNKAETKVDLKALYKTLAFIEKLKLEEKTVIPGKPPRGSTKFNITYKDGSSITLGMNLNEPHLKYYELSTEEFAELMKLWTSL